MPLDGRQVDRIADAVDAQWDQVRLTLFAADLGIDLANTAPAGATVRQQAMALVLALNSGVPPRDGELLEAMRQVPNPVLRQLAGELQNPIFYSPTPDPLDAVLLGRRAFVARHWLRQELRPFAAPNAHTTRVLVVRGGAPGGKSYSWWFLHHLARNITGMAPVQLVLRDTSYTPAEFVQQVFGVLNLRTDVPPMPDGPQQTHIRPLVNTFTGRIQEVRAPTLLVIDDLNDEGVTDVVRETAYALAVAVERMAPPTLWLALLGYNKPITEADMALVAQDDAAFPDAAGLADHLCHVAMVSRPLAPQRARRMADLLLAKHPPRTKEAMTALIREVEQAGEKLRQGLQP